MNWGQAYTKWLRKRGVEIAEIGIHVRIASRVMAEVGDAEVEEHHVVDAKAEAVRRGSTPAQLDMFDTLAAVYMEFQAELQSGADLESEPEGDAGRAPEEAPTSDEGGIDLGPIEPPADESIQLGSMQPPADDGIELGSMQPPADDGIELGSMQPPADDGIDLGSMQPPADDGIELGSMQPPAEAAPVAAPERAGERPDAVPPEASGRPKAGSVPSSAGGRACRYCGGAVSVDYGQKSLAISGVLVAAVGATMGFFLGLVGATAIISFCAAVAAGVGLLLIAQRCEACRRTVEPNRLGPDDQAALSKAKLRLRLVFAASAVGAVAMMGAWFVVSSADQDPRDALLATTVDAVAHRIENDRALRQMSERADPALANDSVITIFFSADYRAVAPSPPEGIGICGSPPERPYCVVVRPGNAEHEIVVEGYGGDRETIVAREVVVVRPQ